MEPFLVLNRTISSKSVGLVTARIVTILLIYLLLLFLFVCHFGKKASAKWLNVNLVFNRHQSSKLLLFRT